VPVALVTAGVLLWLLALGLAFTIFGEISAVMGFACIGAGVVWLVVRGIGRAAADRHPDRHR